MRIRSSPNSSSSASTRHLHVQSHSRARRGLHGQLPVQHLHPLAHAQYPQASTPGGFPCIKTNAIILDDRTDDLSPSLHHNADVCQQLTVSKSKASLRCPCKPRSQTTTGEGVFISLGISQFYQSAPKMATVGPIKQARFKLGAGFGLPASVRQSDRSELRCAPASGFRPPCGSSACRGRISGLDSAWLRPRPCPSR